MYIYFALSDWELSCEYGDYMLIADSWRFSKRYGVGMQNMNHPWGLEVLWNIAWPLCVVPRSMCVRDVSCAITRRPCCVPCPVSQLLFIYFTSWCLPTLLCHVIILFYIVDSWRWMGNGSEDWSHSDTHCTFLNLWNNTCDYFGDDVRLW